MRKLNLEILHHLPENERLQVEAYITTLEEEVKEKTTQIEAYKNSEARYRELIELAPVGICRIDLNGNVVFASATSDRIMGFERNEYINKPLIDLVYAEDRVKCAQLVERLFNQKEQVISDEFRWIRKDGTVVWLEGSGQLKVDEKGSPSYIILSYLDCTNRKKTESLLEERDTLYKALVKNATEGIDIVDISDFHPVKNPNGEILVRNERMAVLFQSKDRLYGTSKEIAEITPVLQPSGESSRKLHERVVKRLYKERSSQEIFRFQHSKDIYFDVEAFEQILEIDGRKLLLRIYHDITERIKQEQLIDQQLQQLNAQNKDLQTYIESNMQLENFAYIASHDLRAPIRNIVSFSNLLERKLADRLEASEQEFLQFIITAAVSMQALIEDLLTFSRANTNKRQLSDISLPSLIEELQHELQVPIEDNSAIVNWPENTFVIKADRIKLKQLLHNLIENALKFSFADRQVQLNIQVLDKYSEWMFLVKDNGIGIDKEFLSKIFLIFKRLHTQDEYEGTGIGLALCKKLVDQHQGRIWVESVPGKGSTFYFTIPKGLGD